MTRATAFALGLAAFLLTSTFATASCRAENDPQLCLCHGADSAAVGIVVDVSLGQTTFEIGGRQWAPLRGPRAVPDAGSGESDGGSDDAGSVDAGTEPDAGAAEPLDAGQLLERVVIPREDTDRVGLRALLLFLPDRVLRVDADPLGRTVDCPDQIEFTTPVTLERGAEIATANSCHAEVQKHGGYEEGFDCSSPAFPLCGFGIALPLAPVWAFSWWKRRRK